MRNCSLLGSVVTEFDRGLDVLRGYGGVGTEPLNRAIDLAWSNGEAHLAQFETHAAEVAGRAKSFDCGELPVIGGVAFPRRRTIPDLLLDEHPGDQHHAKGRPDRELRTNGKIEARHRQVTCNDSKINGMG